MSWRKTCPMNERVQFITTLLQHECTMTELCEHFGVSRRTGYKWWHRYEKAGVEGLRDRSRACRSHPNATHTSIQEKLVALRHRRGWGPRKLLHYLSAREPDVAWPAPSTVGAILKRRGLVKRRRRSRRTAPYSQPFIHCDQPNAVWSADFKGEPPQRYLGQAVLRGSVSRVRPAGGDSHGQRCAICLHGARGSLELGRVVDQAGDPA